MPLHEDYQVDSSVPWQGWLWGGHPGYSYGPEFYSVCNCGFGWLPGRWRNETAHTLT